MSSVSVNATDLYFEESGHGTVILWLQGLGADHTAWTPQVARFAAGYRCLVPDNRGVGRTPPGLPAFDVRQMAEDAATLLAARAGAEPAHVIGLSMGASIAQELALRAPERVRSLVLVAGVARVEPRLRELLLAWREIYPRVPAGTFQRLANTSLFSWRFFERPRAAERAIAFAKRASPPPEWFVAQIDAALGHDAADRLGALRLPTLVIAGSEDSIAPVRLGRDLAERIPDARFIEIPQAGHSVNLEQQHAFNEALGAFLAAH